jgi:hypothetical protein
MSGAEVIDRAFADKFLRAADAPLDYGVYLLFHDWWAEAPENAIEAYSRELASIPEAAPPCWPAATFQSHCPWTDWRNARRVRLVMPTGVSSWTTSWRQTSGATIVSSMRS